MAHQELERSGALAEVLGALTDHGFEGMATAMRILFNEAMKIERAAFLGAAPEERSLERRGYANGFKPKSVRTRRGGLALQVPQVRALPGEPPLSWYPQSLELFGTSSGCSRREAGLSAFRLSAWLGPQR